MTGHGYNKYGDNLARKKRRHFFLRLMLVLLAVIGVLSLLLYVAFFSSFLQITEVSIEGLKNLKPEEVSPIVDLALNRMILGPLKIKPQRNTLFFSSAAVEGNILSQFPIVVRVQIIKDFPHKITVALTERVAIGIWCFSSGQDGSAPATTNCQYFDEEGILWGKAPRSSGSLFLLVDDMRDYQDKLKAIDTVYIESIEQILAELENIKVKPIRIEIPTNSIENINIYTTGGYYVIFQIDSDLSKQIEVLKIFLENQVNDFKPEYIDVRIEGRVYYK